MLFNYNDDSFSTPMNQDKIAIFENRLIRE